MRHLNLSLENSSDLLYNIDSELVKEALHPITTNYKHIAVEINKLWSSKELLVAYLKKLLLDTRSGSRRGFPVEDVLILLFLHNEYAKTPLVLHRDYE